MAFINDLLDLLNTYGKFQVTKPDGSVETATELVITENGTRHTVWKAGNNVTYYVDSGVYYTVEVENGANILNQTPSKDGYTFVGWRRDKLATGTILTNAVMEDDPVTLYAVFSKDITLTYYNATSKAATVTDKQYYNNGNIKNPEFTIDQLEAPTWESRGWATNSKADAAVAYETIRKREFSSDTTVYALYQRTITLSYAGNGSTSGSTSSQTGIRYWNSAGNYINPSFVLASNGYSRSGYTFDGWSLGAVGDTVTLSSDTTAYAQWSDNAYYAIQNGDLVNCPNAQAYIDGDYWDNSCGKNTGYGEPYFYGFAFRAYYNEEEEQYGATGYAVTGNMSTKGCKYMTISVASRTWVSDYPNNFAVYANGDTIYSPTMANSAINTYTIDVSAYSTVSASTWRHIGEEMVAVGGFASIRFHN